MEAAFRHHAALLQAARATPGQGSIALDGKTLRGSFDSFRYRAAAQVLSASATDTALVLAHIDIAEKSNEIPPAQAIRRRRQYWPNSASRVAPSSRWTRCTAKKTL